MQALTLLGAVRKSPSGRARHMSQEIFVIRRDSHVWGLNDHWVSHWDVYVRDSLNRGNSLASFCWDALDVDTHAREWLPEMRTAEELLLAAILGEN